MTSTPCPTGCRPAAGTVGYAPELQRVIATCRHCDAPMVQRPGEAWPVSPTYPRPPRDASLDMIGDDE